MPDADATEPDADATEPDADATEMEDIQARWSEWRIWRSAGGSWMATRRTLLVEFHQRAANTLMEDTADQLRTELEAQDKAEIDAVYPGP